MPLLAAIIIAFLLQGVVDRLERWRFPHVAAISSVFLLFVGAMLAILVVLIPLVVRQAANLLGELPQMLRGWQSALLELPQKYPEIISESQIKEVMKYASVEATKFAETVLTDSMGQIASLMGLVVYLVLVPLMVFFIT